MQGHGALPTVGPVGFDPTTYGLKVRYSAIELRSRAILAAREGDGSAEAKRSQLLPPVGNENCPRGVRRGALGPARSTACGPGLVLTWPFQTALARGPRVPYALRVLDWRVFPGKQNSWNRSAKGHGPIV